MRSLLSKLREKAENIKKMAINRITEASVMASDTEDGNAIVIEIILIVVAVVLCIFFRDEILAFADSLFADVTTQVKNIF